MQQHRVDSLVSMACVSVLTAATLLGASSVASAADGCFEKPGREVEPGHWYYHTDRLHHRRCWFFEPSEATVTPSPSTDRTPAANANYDEPWYSRVAGVVQSFSLAPKQNNVSSRFAETSQNNISAYSSEPPQNSILNNSGSVAKTASPKRWTTHKIARQDQPQLAPPPMTTGLASTARRSELANEKDEKQARQLSDAERQSLFEEFLKWYRERGIYAQP
jgi:hypothetical protein